MTATALARGARAASGLSQSELAQLSGMAGSSLSLIEHGKRDPTFSTLEALLRATHHSLVTIPTVRSDAARIASDIRTVLSDAGGSRDAERTAGADSRSRDSAAFRRFLQLADNLAAEHGATRVGLTLSEPAPTGSAQWDAAIAAVCEYRLAAEALPVPEWIGSRTRDPIMLWAPLTSDYDIPVDQTQVPAEFLSRGILIEAATLESA